MNIFFATTLSAVLLCASPGHGLAQQARSRSAPSTRKDKRIALIEAARQGDIRAVRSVLRKGVDDNAKDTALVIAASNAHVELVRVLLTAGADPNASLVTAHAFATPLGGAVRARSIEVVEVLKAAGAELNPRGSVSPLYFAVEQNDAGMVRALVERGADVNLKNVRGLTALMFASVGGSTEVVTALIEAGADVNLKDDNGDTALAIAERFYEGAGSKEEIVRLLQQAGAKE